MLYMLVAVRFSENLSEISRSRHCSEEELTLIKKKIGEEITSKELQEMIGCSAKMILK